MIASELQILCDQTSPPTPISSATDAMKTKATETVRSKFLAALMLGGANRSCFGSLRDNLANNFAKGEDSYPASMPDVLNLINKYQGQPSAPRRFTRTDNATDSETMFAQLEVSDLYCRDCNQPGHVQRYCPRR